MIKTAFLNFFLDHTKSIIKSNYALSLKLITKIEPELLEEYSNNKAVAMLNRALNNVPAYKDFLAKNAQHGITSYQEFSKQIPFTDRDNYAKKYTQEELCLSGTLPLSGNIDESSGSTGKPFSWVRSEKENQDLAQGIRFEHEYLSMKNNKKIIVLNAFSNGPWAAGVKFVNVMEKFALVKNTEADKDNILNTMKMFGPNRNYLIAGYPPFIKRFIDFARKKIALKSFDIIIITGGEGMAYGYRKYLLKHLSPDSRIYSAYGASDIDIGIAIETPFCILLRDLVYKNKELRLELLEHTDKIPMVFQYDPTKYHIMNRKARRKDSEVVTEFLITTLSKNRVSPRIKYALHDEGRKIAFHDMMQLLKKHEPDYAMLYKRQERDYPLLKLPFLLVQGRVDGTLSLDGANVYPHQIEMCLSSDHELYEKANHFKMKKAYTKSKNIRFIIYIELKEGVRVSKRLARSYQETILARLLEINRDFKKSYEEDRKNVLPLIKVCAFKTNVFSGIDEGIKHKYILD